MEETDRCPLSRAEPPPRFRPRLRRGP
jgi:hypothetical protein